MLEIGLRLDASENQQDDVCIQEYILLVSPISYQDQERHGLRRTNNVDVSIVYVEIHACTLYLLLQLHPL